MSSPSTPKTDSSGFNSGTSYPSTPTTEEGDWVPTAKTACAHVDAEDGNDISLQPSSPDLKSLVSQYHAMAVETEELLHLLALEQGGRKSEDELIEISRGIVSHQIHSFGRDELRELEDKGVTHNSAAQPISHRLYGPQIALSKIEETKAIQDNKLSNTSSGSGERNYLAEALARSKDWENREMNKPRVHLTSQQLRSLEEILPATWDEFSRKCGKQVSHRSYKPTKNAHKKVQDETF
jgi:hypothetical protein